VCYELNEARIRMLKAACSQGSVVCGGRSGRTARILEGMGFVTVEYQVVWVLREQRYSIVPDTRIVAVPSPEFARGNVIRL
jgi:hypothetical protein